MVETALIGSFTEEEKAIINKIADKYNVKFDLDNHTTFDPVGCEYCNNSGFYDRIAVFETLLFDDDIKCNSYTR